MSTTQAGAGPVSDETAAPDPARLLKEALFACLKEGFAGRSYGGVLVAPGKYAWVRYTVETAALAPSAVVPEEVRKAFEHVDTGPLAYRPQELDDWGVIRQTRETEDGWRPVVAGVRVRDSEEEQSAARRERREPLSVAALGPAIVASFNWALSALADATPPAGGGAVGLLCPDVERYNRGECCGGACFSAPSGNLEADRTEIIAEAIWRSDNPGEGDVTWANWLAYVEDCQYPPTLTKTVEECRRRARAVAKALATAPAAPEPAAGGLLTGDWKLSEEAQAYLRDIDLATVKPGDPRLNTMVGPCGPAVGLDGYGSQARPISPEPAATDQALRDLARKIGEAADDPFAHWQVDRVVPVLRAAFVSAPEPAAGGGREIEHLRADLMEALGALAGMVRLSEMGFEASLREPEENGNYVSYTRAKAVVDRLGNGSTILSAPSEAQDAGKGLSLTVLHAANIARQAEWCPDQVPDLSFRGNELAGEAGETSEALILHAAEISRAAGRASNIVKKLERERYGWRGSRATKADLADELADMVICTDLCAVTAGIDLSAAVVAKFNGTSEKQGLATRLPTNRADTGAEGGQ